MHTYELEFKFHCHADNPEAAREQLALFISNTPAAHIAERANCKEIDVDPVSAPI